MGVVVEVLLVRPPVVRLKNIERGAAAHRSAQLREHVDKCLRAQVLEQVAREHNVDRGVWKKIQIDDAAHVFWRIGVDESERTALVTESAFRVARNPIFTAMVITAIGITMMVPNPLALAGLAALLVALELQVRGVEEPYLRTVHGNTYLSYASHVLLGLGRRAACDVVG